MPDPELARGGHCTSAGDATRRACSSACPTDEREHHDHEEARHQHARRGGGDRVVVTGFANDDVRYVMTPDAYVAGQYETVGTPLASGSAAALVDAAAALAEIVNAQTRQ